MTQRQRPTEQQALESVVVTRICNLGRWSREKSSKVLARKPFLQVDAEASSFRELLPTHDLLTTTP